MRRDCRSSTRRKARCIAAIGDDGNPMPINMLPPEQRTQLDERSRLLMERMAEINRDAARFQRQFFETLKGFNRDVAARATEGLLAGLARSIQCVRPTDGVDRWTAARSRRSSRDAAAPAKTAWWRRVPIARRTPLLGQSVGRSQPGDASAGHLRTQSDLRESVRVHRISPVAGRRARYRRHADSSRVRCIARTAVC